MSPVRRLGRVARASVLTVFAAMGMSGCVLVPAPIPVHGPAVVVPRRPVVVVPSRPVHGYGYHHGYGHRGHGRGRW
jgi:hypothetical protein